MIRIQDSGNHSSSLSKYLSPLAVWALAFGCAVGWGSFVMPGTTFLPVAGPWGSVIGLVIGAAVMLIIGLSYRYLMGRYPDAGGSYTYASKVLGSDHGFLCAWMLILTYAAIIWANSTALSLIFRYLFGDIFCFGFSYRIAGYTVYMGEVLLSITILMIACLICIGGKRFSAIVQIISALLLFGGICACFVAVVIHRGGLDETLPAFSSSGDPASQVITIVILAPWAFIGFESISHSSAEFRFSSKKSLPIIIVALLTGVLSYVMLTLCASMATPDGYANWSEYISALFNHEGISGLPTFYAAQQAMGTPGLITLGIAAFCGILTGLMGNYIALSRLIYRLSADKILPEKLGTLNRRGVPVKALLLIAGVSCVMPFFGRTAVGWIVDVTTIGATVVYAYVSICAFVAGKREKKRFPMIMGILGFIFSGIFALFFTVPNISAQSSLAAESYMILILWSVIGMVIFRALMKRDHVRRFGKSTIVWIILFCLILLVSISWINKTITNEAEDVTQDASLMHTQLAGQAGLSPENDSVLETNRYISDRFDQFENTVRRNIFIFAGLILCSIAVVFSIFSIIKQREKQSEAERILAEENSRAKSTFLSNMSHDIRTPMNAITGYTALALNEKDVPEDIRDYLTKIDTSGKHLLSLINDILDMSRIESGKVELDTAPADLYLLFDEIEHIFELQMQSKQLEFTVDYSDTEHRYVICDKNRLNRIMLNLVSNANKYTPAGGKVSLIVREKTTADQVASYEISVSDTGIGMSPEFAEHIFDAFERERSRTVEQIQGTGLGMSITKNLVELMGGTILVKTAKGKGSTFILTLSFPIASLEEVHELQEIESLENEHPDFSGVRILLAEDNPINCEIATMILTQEGFEVELAENGQVAVEKLTQADEGYYSVILMDVQMPVMNGFEATMKIRALNGRRSKIPVIAVTANTFENDRKEAKEAGMNAHVSKPYQPAELVAVIAECIKESEENNGV